MYNEHETYAVGWSATSVSFFFLFALFSQTTMIPTSRRTSTTIPIKGQTAAYLSEIRTKPSLSLFHYVNIGAFFWNSSRSKNSVFEWRTLSLTESNKYVHCPVCRGQMEMEILFNEIRMYFEIVKNKSHIL